MPVGRITWVVILLVGCLVGCERSSAPSAGASVPDGGPDQVSWNARFALSEGGAQRAEIIAGQMEHFMQGDSSYAVLQPHPDSTEGRITAHLFTSEGDSSATLRADRMLYYEEQGRFEAFGRVVVTTPEGKRLNTEHLTWDEADRKIRTPGFVRITTPSEYVEGTGLVAEEDLDTYQLGKFSARVALDDES